MATVLNIIPTIGTRGVWTARAPFAASLLTSVIYQCAALRSLPDIAAAGIDPYAKYYKPYGLTQQQYQSDVTNGAVIITLMAEDGSSVFVPSTWLAGYPDGNGVGYRVMGILVKLTALPDSLPLDPLLEKIESDCLNLIGVEAEAVQVSLSNLELINSTDNANLEAQRRSKITTNTTDFAELQAVTASRDMYQQRCAMLEAWIIEQQGLESSGEAMMQFPGFESTAEHGATSETPST
jgi:hypothetical protein